MDSRHGDARYAPTQVRVEDVNPAGDRVTLASRQRRFWAVLADCGVLIGITFLLVKFFPIVVPNQVYGFWDINVRAAFVSDSVWVLTNAGLLLTRGQTIGKLLLKIRIAQPSGARVSLGSLCARYGVGAIFGLTTGSGLLYCLVDGIFIFRPSRRCLHDMLANTVVLEV